MPAKLDSLSSARMIRANKERRGRTDGAKKQLRIERKRNPYDSSGKKQREREMREQHTLLFVFLSSVVVCGSDGGCACSRWEEKKSDIDRNKTKEYRHQNEYDI